MFEFKFKTGDEVKDRITGFSGVVMCRTQYLTGCNRYSVMSKKLEDKRPAEWIAFDEDQLIETGKIKKIKTRNVGGVKEYEHLLKK